MSRQQPGAARSRLSRFVAVALVAISSWLVADAARAAIIIDDFNNAGAPDYYLFAPTTAQTPSPDSSPKIFKTQGGDVIGNERDAKLVLNGSPPQFISGAGQIGNGVFQFGSSGSLGVWAELQYDGNDPGDVSDALNDNTGLNSIDLTDGGQSNALVFGFLYLAAGQSDGMSVEVLLKSGIGGVETATYKGKFTEKDTFFLGGALYDDFTESASFDWTDVVSIDIKFNTWNPNSLATALVVPNVDFTLDYIRTGTGQEVPEPAGLALLGLGAAAALVMVRRKRIA